MSNLLFMDESNGNGVYATSATAILINNTNINNNNNNSNNYNNNNNNNSINNSGNNIQSLMAAASNAAGTAACSSGGVIPPQLPTSLSNEDLSQSLSEYTDADESISAPTEFLAEFLSSVMLKDYKKALKYCKLILQYEPHNSTAKEFYPLILDKLRGATSSDSDENYNKSSSSPELILEPPSSDPSAGESDEQEALAGEEKLHRQHIRRPHLPDDLRLAEGILDPNSNVSSNSNSIEDDIDVGDEEEEEEEEEGAGGVLSSGSVGVSLSDSVDGDDDDDDDDGDCEDADDDDDPEDDDDDDIMSSSGDDLPVDEHQVIVGDVLDIENSGNACGGAEGVDGVALNGSNSSRNSSSGGKISSRSDNTTHSYSSLLLEEEDDIVPANLHFPKDFNTPDLDVSNGNKIPSTSCSDSESPTEPLTQRLAAILRSKCGVSNTNG
ncbi:probable serine/threonine-protein kinase DDB_G0272254 [Musca vetustissima]|uniref:probable serine/threonine-protein kinase DDB_G0272254 n=1 Tax=Musca vetustissima TaxID=27455 RepID=UPI002AB6FB8D|nr:probable serine/threonine-protein kinase DDB_G0272254 [Musca vetustissima]